MQGLLKLPIELRCAILRELTTVQDLWSAAQSTRVFYQAFQLEAHLMGSVLSAQIDTKLLPYVAALVEFDRSPQKDPQNRSRILQQFFSKTPSQAKEELAEIVPREAVHAIDTYKAIKSFAEKYAARAFALLQKERIFDVSTPPFSPSEMHRIERSFYIFELYCALYGNLDHMTGSMFSPEREEFFAQATPWENEQLACVNDFLIKEFRPADHDIEFGAKYLSLGARRAFAGQQPWFKGFVALGVKFLKRATTASTYNERHRLLQKRLPSATSSPSLEDCLEEPYFLESGEPEWLDEDSWLTDETMAPLVEGPTRFTNSDPYRRPAWIWYSGLEDPDTGPAYIWYRDHEECNQTDHVSSAAFRASREVAYVMMDISRRHAMTQFKGCDVSRRWYHVDEDKRQNEIYEKIRTCELREDIYRRGGRGWWSENDYSQIKWLYSTP